MKCIHLINLETLRVASWVIMSRYFWFCCVRYQSFVFKLSIMSPTVCVHWTASQNLEPKLPTVSDITEGKSSDYKQLPQATRGFMLSRYGTLQHL